MSWILRNPWEPRPILQFEEEPDLRRRRLGFSKHVREMPLKASHRDGVTPGPRSSEEFLGAARAPPIDVRKPAIRDVGTQTSPLSQRAEQTGRVIALDWMRGFVVVLMVLDHVSLAFNGGRIEADSASRAGAGLALPLGQFITRWITHLCAPTFVFLAGLSLSLPTKIGLPIVGLISIIIFATGSGGEEAVPIAGEVAPAGDVTSPPGCAGQSVHVAAPGRCEYVPGSH